MLVLTPEQMRMADEYTINTVGISASSLMDMAGKKVYEQIAIKEYAHKGYTVSIVCGTSNNGGDGLVCARLFANNGYDVNAIIIGNKESINNTVKEKLAEVKKTSAEIIYVDKNEYDLEYVKSELYHSDLIIDALLGTGLKRKLSGVYLDIVNLINDTDKLTVSIDIPTGIRADNGIVYDTAVVADMTVIIQNYKTGNLLNDARDYQGEAVFVDIGIQILENNKGAEIYTANSINFRAKLPKRKINSHKYTYGSVLTLASSKTMVGAGIMSAISSLRAGAGVSTLLVKADAFDTVNAKANIELIIDTITPTNVAKHLVKKDAILFGPGLGRKNRGYKEILKTLFDSNLPMVIDADGLYYLKSAKLGKKHPNLVLTPHVGEMADIMNITKEDVLQDPIGVATKCSKKYGATVALKMANTVVVDTDGIVYINTNGNNGMATAGSGDVLAGIISGLLAQGLSSGCATRLGVYLHGLAGDIALEDIGEHALIASDIIDNISKAYLHILNS